MLLLEKMALHTVTEANYITSVNGMVHPDRIMKEHDFLYMLEGGWKIWEEDTSYEMGSDDLLILAAGRHHYGKDLCNAGNRHMYIHVQPTETEKDSCQKEAAFFCPTLIHCRENPKIRWYFHEIIAAYWSKSPERENRLSLLFSLLLCELSSLLSAKDGQTAPDPMTEEISRIIRTTPQTTFTAKEMAARYFICERTLNNRFLKACGKTFYAFQMETKLEMARQFLLSQPQAKLREAAVNYGFYDEFHLSKAFKKQFGQSPSQYRQTTGQSPRNFRV